MIGLNMYGYFLAVQKLIILLIVLVFLSVAFKKAQFHKILAIVARTVLKLYSNSVYSESIYCTGIKCISLSKGNVEIRNITVRAYYTVPLATGTVRWGGNATVKNTSKYLLCGETM